MRASVLAAVVVAGLGLAACSRAPGGDLAVAVVGEGPLPDTLAAEAASATLIRRGPAGELAPGMATSWRFLDEGDDLIMRLAPASWPARDGSRVEVRGGALSARDVVAGWRRAGSAGRAALAAAGLDGRGTARAPIARVLELVPRPPSPHLLDWLADPALTVRDAAGRPFPGPYRLVREAGADAGLHLLRRAEEPRPDARAASIRITRRPVEAAIAAFDKGEVALVLGEGLGGLSAARAAGQARALRLENVPGAIGLALNPAAGRLDDARLRRALALAADGAPAANRLALALLTVQGRLVDGLPAPADARARPLAERRAEAATLLAAAGHGPGRPLRLQLLVPAGAEYRQMAESLAGDLATAGFDLVLVQARPGGWAAALAAGRHDLALQEQLASGPDMAAYLARWRCGRARPCSPEADRALAAARAAGNDAAGRAAALDAAERALMADPAFIPLLRPVRWALVADRVEGFQTNPLGHHPLGRITAPARGWGG